MLTNYRFYLCILILDCIPLLVILFLLKISILRKIVSAIVSLLIAFLITVVFYCYANKGTEKWNNGYCAECNEPWQFTNANTDEWETSYHFTCNKCHTIITLHHNPIE